LPNSLPGAFSDNLTSRIWVYNYYVDVLKSKDKKTLLKYEPFWENTYYDKYFYPPYPNEWYEYAGTPQVMFFSGIFAKINILSANTINYIVREIKISEDSITADLLCINKDITYMRAR
jgi:hypothetical protein